MGAKRKKAVALAYAPDQNAPEIVASGEGLVADNIIKAAKEHSVPVYEDKKLATILGELKIGDEVPPQLYEIVAQILVFVGDMDALYAKTRGISK